MRELLFQLIVVMIVSSAVLVPPAISQQRADTILQLQIRVRVDLKGIDSTRWLVADIRQTTEGCQLIQLREVGYRDGTVWSDSVVVLNDRAVLKPRRVLAMQTRADTAGEWRLVDIAWFQRSQGTRC
jgi:hypothetical protein